MNQEELKQQIEFYVTHQEAAYQDWWKELNPPTAGVRDVSTDEDPDKLKRRFRNWFEQWYEDNQLPLRKTCRETRIGGKTICEHWLEIRNSPYFHQRQDLMVALIADFIISIIVHLPHTPVSIAIIVTNGYMDIICKDVT